MLHFKFLQTTHKIRTNTDKTIYHIFHFNFWKLTFHSSQITNIKVTIIIARMINDTVPSYINIPNPSHFLRPLRILSQQVFTELTRFPVINQCSLPITRYVYSSKPRNLEKYWHVIKNPPVRHVLDALVSAKVWISVRVSARKLSVHDGALTSRA